MFSREWFRVSDSEREIIGKYITSVPVKLGAMAKELGIEVKLSSLPTNQSGQIRKKSDGKYQIKINRHEGRQRQRFTLAHEISHFLLHRKTIDETKNGIQDTVLYRSGAPESIEYEANRLAADLVMPPKIVDDKLEEYKDSISEELIECLANDFGVSTAAMEIRVRP